MLLRWVFNTVADWLPFCVPEVVSPRSNSGAVVCQQPEPFSAPLACFQGFSASPAPPRTATAKRTAPVKPKRKKPLGKIIRRLGISGAVDCLESGSVFIERWQLRSAVPLSPRAARGSHSITASCWAEARQAIPGRQSDVPGDCRPCTDLLQARQGRMGVLELRARAEGQRPYSHRTGAVQEEVGGQVEEQPPASGASSGRPRASRRHELPAEPFAQPSAL